MRSLEREISKICRKVVKTLLLKSRDSKIVVDGRRTWTSSSACAASRFGMAEKKNQVGQVTGLAWTEVGGELLTIEAVVMPGKGKMHHHRQAGRGDAGVDPGRADRGAQPLGQARRPRGLLPEDRLHIHVPEGATPKDGPSAGIGMCTALVSMLTGIPVRADVAMTGEITLRGEVLPIGGLKEKLLAAHRGGIKTVLIPEENVKDLAEIPDNVKNRLEIVPVKWIDQVLELALERRPEPLIKKDEAAPITPAAEGQPVSGVITH